MRIDPKFAVLRHAAPAASLAFIWADVRIAQGITVLTTRNPDEFCATRKSRNVSTAIMRELANQPLLSDKYRSREPKVPTQRH